MICCNPIHQVCDYAALALYCSPPDLEQIRNGVVPLDSLPAAWWNWMWNDTNKAVNEARSAVGVLIDEVQSVLSNAGVCLNPSCVDQLYQAIDKIRQRIGNATTAGAVKSSSTPGMVSIDDDGLMTANCLGNAANLTTTARTVVGAVNELKQTYDCCFTDVNACLGTLETGRAPIMHASTSNCYGVGSAACYGHLKISDQYTSVLAACSGVAASQMAVTCVYTAIGTCATALQTNIDGKAPTSHASSATTYGVGSASTYGHLKISDTYSSCVGGVTEGVAASQKALYDAYTYLYDNAGAKLGNTVGCALGIASAGVATVAARSDHVHPMPTCVECAGKDGSGCAFGTAARYDCSCFRPSTWTPYCVTEASFASRSSIILDFNSTASSRDICIGYAGNGLTCEQIGYLAAFSTTYKSGCTVIKDASKDIIQKWLGLGTAAYANLITMCVACAGYAYVASEACCAKCACCLIGDACGWTCKYSGSCTKIDCHNQDVYWERRGSTATICYNRHSLHCDIFQAYLCATGSCCNYYMTATHSGATQHFVVLTGSAGDENFNRPYLPSYLYIGSNSLTVVYRCSDNFGASYCQSIWQSCSYAIDMGQGGSSVPAGMISWTLTSCKSNAYFGG